MRGNLGLDETRRYRIPALIAPASVPSGAGGDGDGNQEDPLVTLFIRVNVAGTRPSDDELRFSMLKSVCPDVQDIVERLGERLMPPAKLVTLLSRVILSHIETEPPPAPNLARFRRLVHGQEDRCQDFLEQLRGYLGLAAKGAPITSSDGKPNGRAWRLINEAIHLLGHESWGLPPVSIANLAAGSNSSQFFFLLLAWLDRFPEASVPRGFEDENHVFLSAR